MQRTPERPEESGRREEQTRRKARKRNGADGEGRTDAEELPYPPEYFPPPGGPAGWGGGKYSGGGNIREDNIAKGSTRTAAGLLERVVVWSAAMRSVAPASSAGFPEGTAGRAPRAQGEEWRPAGEQTTKSTGRGVATSRRGTTALANKDQRNPLPFWPKQPATRPPPES